MDILFVVPYPPSLVRVRPYNFVRYLTQRGHRVTVLTTWADEAERQDVERLKTDCHAVRAVHLPRWRSAWNALRAMPGRAPLQASYSWHASLVSPAMLADLRPDAIHVEHLRGARYALWLKQWQARAGRRTPVIWDSVDCISLLFRQAAAQSQRLASRLMTRFELRRTEAYERWLISQFRTLVTSELDRRALLELAAGRQPDLRVIQNGVDLGYFVAAEQEERDPATLLLSGKMSYHANVTMATRFVREVLPHIQRHRPDVRVQIVGKEPTAEVRALGQDPAVTVTGTVPDMRPYLRRATLALAPIAYGAGIQNKVLEALASGTPVVSSPQSVAALAVRPGEEVVVAQPAEEFARAVLGLLADPARRAGLGRAGRRYVERHHDWARIAAGLEETYHDVPAA